MVNPQNLQRHVIGVKSLYLMTEFDQFRGGADFSQLEVVVPTLMLLRRIRGFPSSLRIGEPAYTPAQCRQFLLDAESVGSAFARFLIVSANEPVNEGKDDWLRTMVELSPKYHSFPAVALRSSWRAAAARLGSIVSLLNDLAPTMTDQATRKSFEQHCLEHDETGLSLQDLLDPRLVIFSPLASDYLQACLLQRVVTNYLAPDCFILKPMILNRYLELVAMPDCDADQSWMVGANRKEAFVVNNTSHDTLRATLRAVRELPIPMPLPV